MTKNNITSYYEYKKEKMLPFIDSFRKAKITGNYFIPSMQVGITDKCFCTCPMCGHWQRKKQIEMHLTKYLNFLDIAKKKGLESVGYSGGDPFAYSGINEVIKWHIDNDVMYGIVTAGYVPKNINKKNLIKASWIRMSIDAPYDDMYKKTRGKGITLQDVIKSIEELKIVGCTNLGIGCVLSNITVNNKLGVKIIDDMINFVIKKGISDLRFWTIRSHSNMSIDNILISELKDSLLNAKIKLKENNIDSNIDTTIEILDNKILDESSRCYNNMFQCFITADGNVYPCCSLAGDTEKQARCEPLANIYDVVDRKSYIEFAKACFNFAEIPKLNLPTGCKKECIPRFFVANNIVERYWDAKSFF